MPKKDLIEVFIGELYSTSPKKHYPIIKKEYNLVDGTWSIDLADKVEYKKSDNKGFRYIFLNIDNFSKNLWAMPLKKDEQ